MPKICEKCQKNFPYNIKIDGKTRNLSSRKYCLDCSPFDKHNTKNLLKSDVPEYKITGRNCKLCNKLYFNKGTRCWSCLTRVGRERKSNKLYGLLGDKCWVCGYDKCRQALEFHHFDPKQKEFGLSAREMQYAWKRVWKEAQKCCLLCANCHREVHAGILDITEIYHSNWDLILENANNTRTS
jgi:hypothetical protein